MNRPSKERIQEIRERFDDLQPMKDLIGEIDAYKQHQEELEKAIDELGATIKELNSKMYSYQNLLIECQYRLDDGDDSDELYCRIQDILNEL